MIDFDFNEYCCGCTSCANTCHVNAIRMQANDEGFMMPIVDLAKCIGCGLCEKACPHLNTNVDIAKFSLDDFKDKRAYLYYSKSAERNHSASGGFVNDLFRRTFNRGGWFCGCAWDENMNACHKVSNREEDLRRMQSSKYVQSDVGTCYKEVKRLIKEGKSVSFCGTPCQTAGLKFFLGKDYESDNLVSVCLICHGVPSPKVWNKYKDCLEKKYKGKLVDVNMRDKSHKGYSSSYVKYTFGDCASDGHTSLDSTRNVGVPTFLADPYIYLFTYNTFLRNSCYHCSFKGDNSGADIIVGDFYASTEGAGDMGCSSLIVLTKKGDKMLRALSGVVVDSTPIDVCGVNTMIYRSVYRNPQRNAFFQRMEKKDRGDISFITEFLPARFYIKKYLNKVGLFGVLRRIYNNAKKQ